MDPAQRLQGLPVTDHHFHLRPDGRGVAAAEEFARYGGTRLLLVHSPYRDLPPSETEGFRAGYGRTLDLARRVREATGLRVLVALGPHPAELVTLARRLGLERATAVMRRGLEQARDRVEEGAAAAIGEIGRPHFSVDGAVWDRSNELLTVGMSLAREVECPVVLHTEADSPALYEDLATMARGVGLEPARVVKHHADPLVQSDATRGIFPSVVVKGDAAAQSARQGTGFLMETDYLDDPQRPGAVLGPATVPRRSAALLRDGVLDREALHRIHEDNVRRLYGD